MGPTIVKVVVDGISASPTVIQVDPRPPTILTVQSIIGTAIAASAGAHAGDTLQLYVLNLGDGVSAIDPSRVSVYSPASLITASSRLRCNPSMPCSYLVQFSLSTSTPAMSAVPW
ncbi:MAG: hypothetical protein QM757_32680 [Paludibaculum sp.]